MEAVLVDGIWSRKKLLVIAKLTLGFPSAITNRTNDVRSHAKNLNQHYKHYLADNRQRRNDCEQQNSNTSHGYYQNIRSDSCQ